MPWVQWLGPVWRPDAGGGVHGSPLPCRSRCGGTETVHPLARREQMKIRTAIGLAGASAASLVGMTGLVASPAGAAQATAMPAGELTGYLQTNGFLQTPFGELPGVPIFGG